MTGFGGMRITARHRRIQYPDPVGSHGSESFTIYGTPIPEPGTFLMFGSGLLGVAHVIRRKLML